MKVKEINQLIREQSLTSEKALQFLTDLERQIAVISQNIEISDKQDKTDPKDQSVREREYRAAAADVSDILRNAKRQERYLKPHFGIFWSKIVSTLENILGTLRGQREDTFHRSVDNLSDIIVKASRMMYSKSLNNRNNDPEPKSDLMKLLRKHKRDDA